MRIKTIAIAVVATLGLVGPLHADQAALNVVLNANVVLSQTEKDALLNAPRENLSSVVVSLILARSNDPVTIQRIVDVVVALVPSQAVTIARAAVEALPSQYLAIQRGAQSGAPQYSDEIRVAVLAVLQPGDGNTGAGPDGGSGIGSISPTGGSGVGGGGGGDTNLASPS